MLSVTCKAFYAECRYAECHYADCHGAENIIYHGYKTSRLKVEVKCTDPFHSDSVPCSHVC
jgi:hypothetical protein